MRRLLPVLLAAVAVLATGCFKADLAIKVKEDGSGDIRTVEAFDVDALRRLSGAPDDVLDDLVPRDADLPPGVSASRYSRGSYEGVELRAHFDGVDELDDRLDEIEGALAGSLPVPPGVSGAALGAFHVQPTRGGGWAFTGIGLSANAAGLPPELGDARDEIEVRLAVTLPGRPLDGRHNADEVQDGNTFVWDLSPGDARRRLYAETIPGRASTQAGAAVLPWELAGILVALGAGALGLGLSQRRRRPGPGGDGPRARPAPPGRAPGTGWPPATAPGVPPVAPSGGVPPVAPSGGSPAPAPTGPSGWPLRPPTAPPTAAPAAPPTAAPTAPAPGWGPGLPPRPPDDLWGSRGSAPR